jgi:hypothetical protein
LTSFFEVPVTKIALGSTVIDFVVKDRFGSNVHPIYETQDAIIVVVCCGGSLHPRTRVVLGVERARR